MKLTNNMQSIFKKNVKKCNVFHILLFIAAGIGFYSFVITPYTGDIQVFMAGVNQVKYQDSSGLLALFEAWDMKGIINRLIFYIVYKCTLVFVEYGDIYRFMVVSKIIYGIFAIVIIVISAWLLPTEKSNQLKYGFISYFAVFATFTASQMQAEMSAVLLGILVFSLLMGESTKRFIIGGMIGALFMFIKSILILIFFSILCCVALARRKVDLKKFAIAIVSFCVSEAILFLLIYLIYPRDIQEMKNAAEYQTTLLSGGSNIPLSTIVENFINNYIQSSVAIPFLILGLLCSIYLILLFLKEKNIFKLSVLIMAWLFSIDIIVISNCYFIYHYFTLIIPCIISIYLYLIHQGDICPGTYYFSAAIAILGIAGCWKLKKGIVQVPFINYSTVLIVLMHLIVIAFLIYPKKFDKRVVNIFELLVLSVGLFFYGNYSSFISPKSRNLISMTKSSAEIMKNLPGDFGDEPVLLLDSGTVTFYKDAESYSEYYYNLPMQRWSSGKKWDVQESEYNKFMNYSGKYIVYMSWFELEKYPELQSKIEKEYVRLDGSGYWPYSATWDMFQLDEAPDFENVKDSEDMYILIRKD